jgi:signal transduction histidine kinase
MSRSGEWHGTGNYAENVLRQVSAWTRDHPRQADGLLAVVLLAFSAGQVVAGQISALERVAFAVVTVVLAATVIPRRRYPGAAFTVAVVIGAAQIAFGVQDGSPGPVFALQPTNADLAILVLLYTLAAYRPRPVSITGLVVCLLGSAVAIASWAPSHAAHPTDALLGAVAGLGGLTLAAWVLGDSVAYRYRRTYYASLEDRAARLEAERDAQARIAAAAERARELAERARELQERRARAVDESAARLRRIERDLHDGAQVRLAALAMTLGEIKENLEQSGDDRTLALAGAAHQNAKDTLAELRDLARGIHPPVLDRGLGPALGILAGTSAIPVGLTIALTERPSPAIESMAYFCTAELLANAAKHSDARRITIGVREQDAGLVMSVTDDGNGGARVVPGGGLAGLRERVQTVDGRLDVDSPPGGPTAVTIELPRHA